MSHLLPYVQLLQVSFSDVYAYLLTTTGLGGLVGYLVARKNFKDKSFDNAQAFEGMHADQVGVLPSNFGNTNTTPNGNLDTIQVWYSLDTLVNFLNEVANSVSSATPSNPALGVRFYMSRYPQDPTDPIWTTPYTDKSGATVTLLSVLNAQNPSLKTAADYAGRQTVMMVPTYDIVSGADTLHVDFDPWSFGTFATSVDDAKSAFATALISGGNLAVMNHGQIMPPPPPPSPDYSAYGVFLNN
jgi:hypothetical protein